MFVAALKFKTRTPDTHTSHPLQVMMLSTHCSLQLLTFDHSQVHDHLLVIEDAVNIHPAAVRSAVCPPHTEDVQIHLSVQDVSCQPVAVRHLHRQSNARSGQTLQKSCSPHSTPALASTLTRSKRHITVHQLTFEMMPCSSV